MSAQADLFTGAAGNDLSGALFSPGRHYRYRLWRCWGPPDHRLAWVMLNPSKANETDSDLTITRCIGFAKRWGFSAIDVVNIFGLVSTDPNALLGSYDPVGPGNHAAVADVLWRSRRIVLAYGSHDTSINRLVRAQLASPFWRSALVGRKDVVTLGRARDGAPRHPSRLAYETPVEAA